MRERANLPARTPDAKVSASAHGSMLLAPARVPRYAPGAPLLASARRFAVPPRLQAKLDVSAPGDSYEQEADAIADRVMRMPDPALVPLARRAPQTISRKCATCEDEAVAQRSAASPGTPQVTPRIEAGVPRSGGQPLPASARAFFEPRMGHDFSRVRVHADLPAAASARALRAQAYTLGNHVVFGEGRYSVDTTTGRCLLAHELAHVVQQGAASPVERFTPAPPSSKDSRASGGDREHGAAAGTPEGHLSDARPTPSRFILQRSMLPPSPGVLMRAPCAQTNRYPGNQEHVVLESYYQTSINTNSAREFELPGSGPNGGTGYADIADLASGAIYDFKVAISSPPRSCVACSCSAARSWRSSGLPTRTTRTRCSSGSSSSGSRSGSGRVRAEPRPGERRASPAGRAGQVIRAGCPASPAAANPAVSRPCRRRVASRPRRMVFRSLRRAPRSRRTRRVAPSGC